MSPSNRSQARVRGWSRSSSAFSSPRKWEADENNLAAAGAKFLNCFGGVAETGFDRLAHVLPKHFPGDISRRRGRGEKRQPDLLDPGLQFTGLRAVLGHARAAFAIDGLEVRRESRRDLGVGAVRNREAL